MIMKICSMFLVALLSCSLCYGQSNYFKFGTVKFQDQSKAFTFPIFKHLSNNYSTEKINQLLQISELELLEGFEERNIFEKVSIDDGRIYGGKVDIDFRVQTNNQKLLSIKFNQSSCGATCAYWVRYYNFNSGNGDLIQLKDLFTSKGYKSFVDFVTQRRILQLKKEIKKLKPNSRDAFYDIIGSYETDKLFDYFIKGNELFIDGENSFYKNQKFDGIETVCKFKLSEFKHLLNPFGKSLFFINKQSVKKYQSQTLPQLFQGTIADKSILLVLNTDYDNKMRGVYVYSKYGKGIFLEGSFNGIELNLIEKLAKPRNTGFIDYVDNGFIKANFDGQKIKGTWANKDKTQIYDLELIRK